jgi:hypothetical protein
MGGVLIGGLLIWPRIESLCLTGGQVAEAAVVDGKVSLEGRTYLVRTYVSADYGAHLFPSSVLRGHPVAAAAYIRGADDAPLTETIPTCIRVQHGGEVIERRARFTLHGPSGGSAYTEITSGICDLPEWQPGDSVRVWLRLTVNERPYLIDIGEATIASVG